MNLCSICLAAALVGKIVGTIGEQKNSKTIEVIGYAATVVFIFAAIVLAVSA